MRRLLALALLAAAATAPAASAATRPLPCDYWVHGCDLPAYVYDFCDRNTTIDCGIV